MAFVVRPYRRFPVQCPVSYSSGPFHGVGHSVEFLIDGLPSLGRLAHEGRGNAIPPGDPS
jgi:hypothetical protein